MSVISLNYKSIESPEFIAKYGALTEDIVNDGKITKVYYMPMFIMHRTAFGAIMIYLYRIPEAAIPLLALLHGAMIVYILYFKPFASFGARISLALDELSMIVFLIYAFVLQLKRGISE